MIVLARRALVPYSPGPVDSTITDSDNHPPPTSGPFNYNDFTPPALGDSYIDPIFGKEVRRVSDTEGSESEDQIYSFHSANADGTLAFFRPPGGGLQIIDLSDGSYAYTNQPFGLTIVEVRWSMLNPDKYTFFEGTNLRERTLSSQTTTTLKNFGQTLQNMGGSNNYVDAADELYLVLYQDLLHVWRRSTDTIFTNSVPPNTEGGGASAITPSGKHVLTFPGTTPQPQKEHYSYALNLGTNTMSTTPVQFWGIGGGHCAIISCSDGKDYAIFPESYDEISVYRIDVTVDVAGLTPAQQRAAATLLLDTHPADDQHMSGVSVGAYQDWFFISLETYDQGGDSDDFDEAVGAWRQYKQEIIAINALTVARRRLAHHRSRSIQDSYYYTPRVSCSPTGNICQWASNMNNPTPLGYADSYIIANPLTSL